MSASTIVKAKSVFTTAEQLCAELVANNTVLSLEEFTEALRLRCYPTTDVSFMSEFLELAHDRYAGQFIVPHMMLTVYGISASKTEIASIAVERRAKSANLVEGVDYIEIKGSNEGKTNDQLIKEANVIAKSEEKFESRINSRFKPTKAGRSKNLFVFTPDAFFELLMNANTLKTQKVNPKVYRTYFIFLQKIHLYFSEYQNAIREKELAEAKKTISEQKSEFDSMMKRFDEQCAKADAEREQAAIERERAAKRYVNMMNSFEDAASERDVLQESLDRANEEITEANTKLVELKDTVVETNSYAKEFARRSAILSPNEKRRPFISIVYGLVHDECTHENKIRFIIKRSQYGFMIDNVADLLVGRYKPTRTHCDVQIKWKLALSPMYFPDPTNLVEAVKNMFKDKCKAVARQVNKRNNEKRIKLQNHVTAFWMRFEKATDEGRKAEFLAQYNLYKNELDTFREAHPRMYYTDVPVKFGQTVIDFKSNPYFKVEDIVNDFTTMINKTHGCVYMGSHDETLRDLARENADDFLDHVQGIEDDSLEAIKKSIVKLDEAILRSTELLSAQCVESVLSEEEIEMFQASMRE